VDVLFLDANVLYSAAYRQESRLGRFWTLPGVELVTSAYAIEEARRNLARAEQVEWLDVLAGGLRIVHERGTWALPRDVILPDKDRPILAAAVISGATHLITGDQAHFGVWYGQLLCGIRVLRPAAYLDSRR
jgi:predicted nucleic acid-binding protein